ncbi:MAG TPA: pyridoxal-dependent decarboxylase [Streptosporangiaceae bacterium]|nr:pyridoxal-dependent decarboxylase [Streptosporangiaceae bacterium]
MGLPAGGDRAAATGRAELLAEACQRALAYLDGLATRRVGPAADAVAALDRLDFPLPAAGRDPLDVLRLLDEAGSPATVASAGPRYFGFVTGGTLPAAQAAAWLGAAWDQNAALTAMSPVAARLDAVALRWVTELLGLPAGTEGGFVTGATMANAACLAAARDAVLARHGWDAAGQGLAGAPPVTVVAGAEAHTTVRKALALVGLGRDRVTALPADEQGAIIPCSLPGLTGPALVCLQAGNVNSGASDPFRPLLHWAREQGAWVHVDGAFGLWAAASPATAGQVAGVAGADSWATDSHKWLNTTYDCGIALVREPGALPSSMAAPAAYLPGGSGREPMHFTPQSSQRARGAEVWAALAALGRDGVAELVDRTCRLARRFAGGIRAAGYQVLNEVVLNQVVVDFGDPARTAEIIAAIQAEGTCWCGQTSWRGRQAMRVSVSCWSTADDDIDASVAAIRDCARRVTGRGAPGR